MLVTPKVRLATLQLLHRSMWLKSAHLAIHARECLEQGLDEMPSADISDYGGLPPIHSCYGALLTHSQPSQVLGFFC